MLGWSGGGCQGVVPRRARIQIPLTGPFRGDTLLTGVSAEKASAA
jgi:hypothetical protein